jgi:hypothetical protein
VTIPALGVAGRPNRRDDLLLIPPRVRVQAEWKNAAGRIATFSLESRFLQGLADQTDAPFLEPSSLVSFSIDPSLDGLCRLLMEETEARCSRGPLYFEALARALAVSLLCRLRTGEVRHLRANPACLQAQARAQGLAEPCQRENVPSRAKTFYTGPDTGG